MNDIDISPAEVAAQITGCQEGIGVRDGYCAVHAFIGHGFDVGRWPCDVHTDATEVIRAAMERMWDKAYDRGFYDRDFMRTEEARDASEGKSENPYEVKRA